MHEGLSQLGHLLHPQRVGSQLAVAGFSKPHVEQDLVRPFERGLGGEARQLAHHADKGHRGHICDEGVVLRHVADQSTDLPDLMSDVVAENLGRAGGHRAETEQSLDQSGFARPVGSEQPKSAPRQGNSEVLQDLTFAKTHTQSGQLNDRLHEIDLLRHHGHSRSNAQSKQPHIALLSATMDWSRMRTIYCSGRLKTRLPLMKHPSDGYAPIFSAAR